MCLQGCDLMANEDLLMRPTQQYITTLFEQILDSFTGISCDTLWKCLNASAGKVENTESQNDTRTLLGLQRIIHQFLIDCGIDDFNIMDILKPEPQRYRRILSAVVNFARFREEHMADCEDLVQQTDQNAIKLRELAQEIDELKIKIVELEQINSGYDGKLNSIQQHNNKVEDELRRLKKIQEQLASEHVQDKQEKQRLVKKLEDDNFLIIETRKENDKMRPYVVEAPDMLHKINNDMNESLQQEKSLLRLKEKQIREYEISTDSIRLIDQEIKSCLKALEEIEAEVQRRDENVRKLNKFQELHDQRKLDSKDLDRKIQQLRRQTSVSGERVERAAMQRDQKNEQAKQRMTELYELHAKLMAERDISKQEVTKKKMYIEQAEMQMEEIKQTFEVEVKQTTKEAERLQTHINMYLNEMERRLAEYY